MRSWSPAATRGCALSGAGLQAAPLARSLHLLREAKRVVAADLPVSTHPAREPRYRVADSYLRFWLRFIEPALADISVIGGYWTRSGSAEVDLVGVDQWPGATRVSMIGSIKWRDCGPFDQRDLLDLAAHRVEVPGGHDAMLIAVSRSGCTAHDLTAAYSPEDLVSAWSNRT
jgi:uncharacterized protein